MSQAAYITDLIRKRRSIFPPSYIEKEIPKEIIEVLLENANYAPTHRLTEPWRFVVFLNEQVAKLAQFMAENYRAGTTPETFVQSKYDAQLNKFLKAGCIIVVNMEVHPNLVPEWEETAAVAIAVQNMWLTATEFELGAYWGTPGAPTLEALHEFLGLPESQKCLGLFLIGYHQALETPARRNPIEGKTTWITD